MIGNNVEEFSFEAYKKAEKTELYDSKIEVPFAALAMVYLIQLSSRTIGNTGSTFWKTYLEKKN